MSRARVAGLFFTALSLTVVAASGPLGAQVQPQIKPGMPPAKPGAPPAKPADPPKGKTPPKPKPGDPKMPALPPVVVSPANPPKKKDDIKWPKDVNGKKVEDVIKEMRDHNDPGAREAAVRMLPLFGPRGREFGATELVELINKDPDWQVRLAGLSVAPTVLYGFAESADPPLMNGLNTMMNMLYSDHLHIRYDAIGAVAAIGPYMRVATGGKVTSVLISRAKDQTSWHMRRAAVIALGQVGQGMPKGEEPEDRDFPDQAAVNALLDIVRADRASAVRREAINSLVALGPVASQNYKQWRSALDFVLGREKDKSVLLWTKVCILLHDPKGVDGNPSLLNDVAVVLQAKEPLGRLEACQAFAQLGEKGNSKLQDLLDIIQKPDEDPAIVAAAITAVATMRSQAKISLPLLDKIKVSHPVASVKAVAMEASEALKKKI
jgi:HEAT repeat protein